MPAPRQIPFQRPACGALRRARTNLLVFLRPIIIRNNAQSVHLSQERYDFMRLQSQRAAPERSASLPEPGAPRLPQPRAGKLAVSIECAPALRRFTLRPRRRR